MLRRGIVGSGAVLVLIAFLASAQAPKGPGRGGFGGPFFGPAGAAVRSSMLLPIPDVQKELGLGDEQQKAVADLLAETRKQMQSSMAGMNFQDMQKLSEEDRRKRFAEISKKAEEVNKQVDEKIAKILDAKQLERLFQLRVQREGVTALERSEVADKLGLSEDQKAKIKKVQEDAAAETRKIQQEVLPNGFAGFQNLSEDERRDFFTRVQKQREKLQADLLAVLTDEQKTKWTELKGKEFKFPQMGFGMGGGGERRRPPAKKAD